MRSLRGFWRSRTIAAPASNTSKPPHSPVFVHYFGCVARGLHPPNNFVNGSISPCGRHDRGLFSGRNLEPEPVAHTRDARRGNQTEILEVPADRSQGGRDSYVEGLSAQNPVPAAT